MDHGTRSASWLQPHFFGRPLCNGCRRRFPRWRNLAIVRLHHCRMECSKRGCGFPPVWQFFLSARKIGIDLLPVEVRERSELLAAFKSLPRSGVRALILFADAMFLANREEIAVLAAAGRLPAVYGTPGECRCRRSDQLRRQLTRKLASSGGVCRQDSERWLTSGPTCGTSHEIRAGGQSPDCQSNPRSDTDLGSN